ncbi:MAG: YhbY family RNA-binding protein, partial [Firmicutes bacterium]|nr:YhbY family RNA-binding protein [Bacillota bacterium]
MLTGKQRSYLKSLAHELEPTVYVGKFGMTENIIKEMEIGFETRELVKIKLQEGCELSKDEVADMIIEKTGC